MKLGEYHYAPRGACWNVYVVTSVYNDGCSSAFVKQFATKEEARQFVYEKNGWIPKKGA